MSPPQPARTLPRAVELSEWIAEVAARHRRPYANAPELIELTAEELAAEATRIAQRDTPSRTIETQTRLLTALELAPADFDWLHAVGAELARGLRAFYDPERRIIFSDRALPAAARRRVLTHELVHVLQVESWAPEPLEATASWDRENALHSLREGDAEVFAARWTDDAALVVGPSPSGTDSGTPDVLRRAIAALYIDGQRAVERAYAEGGWTAVNALLDDPPRTTRELLHPEATRAKPRDPSPIAAPPGSGWALGAEGAMGEQALRCVLEEWLPPERATALASSWREDHLAWFGGESRAALAWRFDVETTSAARQLHESLSVGLSLPRRAGQRSDTSCRAHRDGGVIAAARQTEQVWVLRLHDLSTEAGCREVSTWLAQLTPRASASCGDPGAEALTGPR